VSDTSDLIFADVSEWQGSIDWSAYVRAGHPAASVRAYNGSRADSYFGPDARSGHRGNRALFWAAGGQALGIYAYLVDVPELPVADQANGFCDTVGALRAGEWPILDLEEGPGDQSGRASAWRQVVHARLGVDPWLYTGLDFYRTRNLAAAGFAPGRLIIADYSAAEPGDPAHAAWQFTDAYGPMPGISGAHDANVHHGAVGALLASLGPGAPAPAGPVPFPGTGAFLLGHSNPNVTLLGQWLIERGYGRFYSVGPGPVLGPHDVEATRQFQLDQGWRGENANGYPGPVTWQRLQDPATRPPAHAPVPFPGVGAFLLGRSNPNVTLLGQWLVDKGYGRFYAVGPGPVMGEADVSACAQFQRDQGWSGTDANGYPGPVTWARLQQ